MPIYDIVLQWQMQGLSGKERFALNIEEDLEADISALLNFVSNYFFSVVILTSNNLIGS